MSEAPQFRDFNELLRTEGEAINAHIELVQDNVVDTSAEMAKHHWVEAFLTSGAQLARLLDHPEPERGEGVGYRALQFAYQVYGDNLEAGFECRFGEYFDQAVASGNPSEQITQDAHDYLTLRPHLDDFITFHADAIDADSWTGTELTHTMLTTAFRLLDDSAKRHSSVEDDLLSFLETATVDYQFADLTNDLVVTPAGHVKEILPKTDAAKELQNCLSDHLVTFESFSDYDASEQAYILSMLERYITHDNNRLEAFEEDDEIVASTAGFVLIADADDDSSCGVEVLASDVRLHGKVKGVAVIEAPLYIQTGDAQSAVTGLSVALRIDAASMETVSETSDTSSQFEDFSPDVEVYLPLTYVSDGMTIVQHH